VSRLLPVVGLVAACASLAAVSVGRPATSAAEASHSQTATPNPGGYDVSVTFDLGYRVDWKILSGHEDPTDPCATWRDDRGDNYVRAQNLGVNQRPKRLKPLQGHFFPSLKSILPPGYVPPGTKLPELWAKLDVLGAASMAFVRQWRQNGGPPSTPCDGRPVVPFQRYDDDCGARVFTIDPNQKKPGPTKRAATISAAYTDGTSDLVQLTHPYQTGKTPVLTVTIPTDDPFKKCRTTSRAPESFRFVSLPVPLEKSRALQTLGLNKTVRIEAKHLEGNCDDQDVLDHDNICTFWIHGWVAIRHIQRNPYKR
jgi:hypothetical protein